MKRGDVVLVRFPHPSGQRGATPLSRLEFAITGERGGVSPPVTAQLQES